MGDFNLPSLRWGDGDGGCASPVDRQFYDAFLSLGLTQWVSKPTYIRSDNVLDLVFTTSDDRVLSLELLAPLPNCHHMPVCFDYAFAECLQESSIVGAPNYLWFNGDYPSIINYLSSINWDIEFYNLTVGDMYTCFVSVLMACISSFVPTRLGDKRTLPPWKHNPPKSVLRLRSDICL